MQRNVSTLSKAAGFQIQEVRLQSQSGPRLFFFSSKRAPDDSTTFVTKNCLHPTLAEPYLTGFVLFF